MTTVNLGRGLDKLLIHSVRPYVVNSNRKGAAKARRLNRYVLIGMTGGQAALSIDGAIYSVEKGDLLLVQPGAVIKGMSAGTETIQCALLCFSAVWLVHKTSSNDWLTESSLGPLRENVSPPIIARKQDKWEAQLSRFAALYKTGNKLELKHELLQFLHDLLSGSDDYRQEEPKFGMDHALRHMQEHYTEEWNAARLASLAGLSVNHFVRTFKLRMGMTPTEYMMKLRIDKAKELLFSSRKMKVVAKQAGYKDEHYFSRVFKKVEGIAPTLYMRNRCHRIAAMYYGLDDYLLTLGITPVATLSYARRVSHSHEVPLLGSSARRLDSVAMNYGGLQQTQPDLILTSDRLQRDMELERIAPTATIPYTNCHEERLDAIADILGRKRQSDIWKERYAERQYTLRRLLKERLGARTVYYIRISDNFCRVYGNANQTGALLYNDLGLTLPEEYPRGQWAVDIGIEELPRYNADYVLLAADPSILAQRRLQELLRSEQWAMLDAVKKHRVYDASDLLFKTLGPTGRMWAMDHVSHQLLQDKG